MSGFEYRFPIPKNEPVLEYRPGSEERKLLEKELEKLSSNPIEIPLKISGKEIKTGKIAENRAPHDRNILLCTYHQAEEEEIKMAVEAALKAWGKWSRMPYYQRAAIFLKAADLLATKYRHKVNAAVMLGQSKNPFQAEIDVCELIDFWRYNAHYLDFIYSHQPDSPKGQWNRLEYRPLEGFIFAVTPFNFVSIAGNLPTAPAMMGNVSIWKPASTSVFSNYFVMEILREAGLPEDVVVFLPGSGSQIGKHVLTHPDLAGIHFTGSTSTFQFMWKAVGENIKKFKSYPRIVGETGGKDFVFAHKSADIDALAVALVRGAYEYQGQKCSAASRAYIPESMWNEVLKKMKAMIDDMSKGDVKDAFFNAVIDEASFDKIVSYIENAKKSDNAEIAYGGTYDKSKGYFIDPTIVVAKDPHYETMEEELFGPVLTVYLYDENKYEETLHLCDETSPYGLTGAVFSNDREAVELAEKILRHAAGNFYINDKPTGAVVGQQPFGGSRLSGTNDKAGSYLNLIRWTTPRTIKETFVPPIDYKYPFMG